MQVLEEKKKNGILVIQTLKLLEGTAFMVITGVSTFKHVHSVHPS
jgi:ribosomal silencing factor RsfS